MSTVTLEGYCGGCGSGVTMLNYGPLKGPKPDTYAGFCAACGSPLDLRRPAHSRSPKERQAVPAVATPSDEGKADPSRKEDQREAHQPTPAHDDEGTRAVGLDGPPAPQHAATDRKA